MKRKYLILGGAVWVAILIFFYLIPKPTPEGVCLDAFSKQFGEEFKNPKIKEKIWNAVSFDISGYYSGGVWSCALSNNPLEFQSGQLRPTNSKLISFSADELNGK